MIRWLGNQVSHVSTDEIFNTMLASTIVMLFGQIMVLLFVAAQEELGVDGTIYP